MFETQKEMVTKAMHSTIGAPVVAKKVAEEYVSKLSEYADRLVELAQARYDESVVEGEKIAKRFQSGTVVEEIQHRVDMDKVQDRVGKLRDQLEAALDSWRENFTPETKPEAKKVQVEAGKPAPKKTAAKTTAAKKPAAKKAPAKTTAARKPAAKKTTTAKTAAAKKPAAKKAPARKAPAKTTAARKPAAAAKK